VEKQEYLKLLHELKMDGLQRILASPLQFKVTSYNSLLINIAMLNNKENPVWMSQNRYQGPHMIAEKVFNEFEGKGKSLTEQKQSHSDMLKLLECVEKNKWRMVVLHSGSKSFHSYIHVRDIADKPENFSRTYDAVGKWVKNVLGCKSIDLKCAEPKRLHRVPLTSPHGKGMCIPIPIDMLTDLKSIIELTQHPIIKFGKYQTKGEEVSLKEIMKITGAGHVTSPNSLPTNGSGLTTIVQPQFLYTQDKFLQYLDSILTQKCVLNDLLTVHPEHETRVAFVAWLVFLHFNEHDAISICDKLADVAQWDDKSNVEKRRYYVSHAIHRKYLTYSCRKLRDKGLKCVGTTCPMYGSR